MPGVVVRRTFLSRGAAASELHFPWCPEGRAAAPCGARVRPPCRRPRERAGGTNTRTTSTASGSTAAPAAAPRPASPGERWGHGGRGLSVGWGRAAGSRRTCRWGGGRAPPRDEGHSRDVPCLCAARTSAKHGTRTSQWRRTWPRWAWPRIPTRLSPSRRSSR